MQRFAHAMVCGAFAVLAGTAAGSGCGGDDGGGRPSIRTSQDTVCDAVAEVACFDMFQCCAEGEIERFLAVSDPRTEDECRDDVRAICERQKATIDFSVNNNRVQFDASVMNACLEALLAPDGTCATIAAMLPWATACLDSAWTGTVATGGPCDFPIECGKDSVCNSSRVCAALPGDAMPCVAGACATGLFCNTGTCRPQLAEGATCIANVQCQKGLFCDTTAVARTCTRLHEIGERCTGNTTCLSGTCLPGTCAGSTAICTSALGCSAHCADDNSFCISDGDCLPGTCSGTTTTCFSNAGCTDPAICVFPVKCLPAECMGDVVCAEAHIAVDYCTGAVNAVPFF